MPSGNALNGSSVIFQALMSTAWETIDQNFYTRLAQTIDPVDSVITFYAEILSSGILKSLDKEGNDISENDDLIALLKNPNENQNFHQFIKEWLYYLYAHGYCYVVPKSNSVGFENKIKAEKNAIYNVDPDHIEWNNQSSILNFFNRKKEISFNYKTYGFNQIKYTDVINFIDVRQNSEKPYLGVSRLLALRRQIQNYYLALQGDENLIKRSGSILVSLDTKTEDMGLDTEVGTGRFDNEGNPITTTHKEKLEQQLRETGLGTDSNGIMFSTLPLKSQPLSAGLENIKFNDKMVDYARQIFNKYNVPKEFQNLTTETAKFANRQLAMIEVIQNTIQPLADSFCNKIQSYYNWENKIIIDFSHLPVFSDNEQTRIETQQAQVNLYVNLFEKGIIEQPELTKILQEYGII